MKIFLRFIGALFLLLILVIGGVALTLEASLPTNAIDLRPMSKTPITSEATSILIFGATRNTGLMVARLLEARGENVTAFVRPVSDTTELKKIGVELVVGDAMDIATVQAAFEGRDYEAVLTTIGCLSCVPPSDYQANANVIKAAMQAGVRRLVLVTSIGSGDSLAAVPALSARFLAKTIPLKTHAEEDLRASGLEYTIIRPGGLRSGRRTGHGTLSEDRDVFGYIFREDLAELIVSVFDDSATIGKTLAAVDAYRRFPWDNE
ncbi:MAG: SDR family oxidoreductase [Gammaproteobacteria bacterium]|jgi:uncharacterized protein YbjT (DUF2867 family)|nr:hypothetical protein [Chromatiales bacterium]MDP6674005.1 SDR family oxidoreductase [Gammaproteobacteria bacterium]